MLSYIQIRKDSEEAKIMMKSTDQIRNNFLSRLAYNKLWVSPSHRPKTHQTCIIFDWDDTILCTSFLAPYPSLLADPNRRIPSAIKEDLSELDEVATNLLKMAKSLGMTFIITNAAEGWVESSSERFLPKVHKEVQSDIRIVSARTKFQKHFPHDYQEWKIRAFLEA